MLLCHLHLPPGHESKTFQSTLLGSSTCSIENRRSDGNHCGSGPGSLRVQTVFVSGDQCPASRFEYFLDLCLGVPMNCRVLHAAAITGFLPRLLTLTRSCDLGSLCPGRVVFRCFIGVGISVIVFPCSAARLFLSQSLSQCLDVLVPPPGVPDSSLLSSGSFAVVHTRIFPR